MWIQDESYLKETPVHEHAGDGAAGRQDKSLWRKRSTDGILARSSTPPRPAAWSASDAWMPEQTLALIQAGLLQGKPALGATLLIGCG